MITTQQRNLLNTGTTTRQGFTLIEIMIAIVIVGIMGGIGIGAALSYYNRAKVGRAKAELKNIQHGIDMYLGDIGQYPGSLKDLVKRPADEKIGRKWQEGYIKGKEVPEDPWGNRYHYKVLEAGAEHPYELYSYGANGKGSPKNEWLVVWDL